MKIEKCNFTEQSKICVALLPNGSVLIGNAETGKIYKITSVKLTKSKQPKGVKKVKLKLTKNKLKEYKRGSNNE